MAVDVAIVLGSRHGANDREMWAAGFIKMHADRRRHARENADFNPKAECYRDRCRNRNKVSPRKAPGFFDDVNIDEARNRDNNCRGEGCFRQKVQGGG